MTMTMAPSAECLFNVSSDWEIWGALPSDELATEVRNFASPLLEESEIRSGLYDMLRAMPSKRLEDIDLPADPNVFWAVKDETQHPGSAYKLRGAYWNIMTQLNSNSNITQVHCTSTGNHGLGVIEACRWINEHYGTNLEPVIHVPKSASDAKVIRLKAGGATIEEADTFEQAHEAMNTYKVASIEPHSTVAVVEPYDDPRTMAGQASCGYEIVADLVGNLFTREGVDLRHDEITLWVPGGGGGFAAGCAVALDHYRQLGYFGANIRVKVAQMEGCDALAREYCDDEPLTAETLDKSADATAILKGGNLTQKILADERFVADIVSIPKGYVGLAMEILERQYGHTVEPAGALALAASLWYEDAQPRRDTDPRRVHLTVMSGANVSNETRDHFAATVPELRRERFSRQSLAHRERKVHGVSEVLARAQGRTAVNKLLVANGPTS